MRAPVYTCTRTHTGMHAAGGGAGEKPGVLFQTVGLSLKRGMLLRVAYTRLHVPSRLQERDGEGVRTNEKQDSRPSTLLRAALTTFIVFPCSIERNVTLPPLSALLGRPSSFDSGFFLSFFFRRFLCAPPRHPERIVKHALRPRGYVLHVVTLHNTWKKTERGIEGKEEERERVRSDAKGRNILCVHRAASLLSKAGNPNPNPRACEFGTSGKRAILLGRNPFPLPSLCSSFFPSSSFLYRATVSDGTVT